MLQLMFGYLFKRLLADFFVDWSGGLAQARGKRPSATEINQAKSKTIDII
ncbi:MAG: hypothetical protein ACI4XS_04360 [Bacillus sp. (in: firmicutes)]